jgi:class 3 adenylate cyclase
MVVPTEDNLKPGNDAVEPDATLLYADLADSTKLMDGYKNTFAAEISKMSLHRAAKIIESDGGALTAYDGDRITAVFIGGINRTSAVRAAMKIKWAASSILNPGLKPTLPPQPP